MTWCEREWPNILSTCKIKHTFDIAARDVYCSTVMLRVLRNAFDIHVLTAINHSETDWNIRHAFWIWAYTDYFGSPRTPLMSVFGVWKDFSDVNTPKTSISASAASQEGLIDDLYHLLQVANSNILTPEIHIFYPAKQIRFSFTILIRVLKHIPR